MRCNAFTVDVEDWYHDAEGLGRVAPIDSSPRVDRALHRLFDLLDETRTHATLFFLGEVAERFPDLVREAKRRGHEIASHGYHHRPLASLTRREFRDEVRRSLGRLGDLAAEPVRGYRAPYFSIKAGVRWPLEVLAEEGLVYDSSILPIDRPPGLEVVTPRVPYRLDGGLWEIPVSVPRIGFWNLPLFGGFALRVLPVGFVSRRIGAFNRGFGAAVMHVHPWEIDARAPEAATVPGWVRVWKRVGREGLEEKLRAIFSAHPCGSIAEAFPELCVPTLAQRSPSA